MHVLQQDKPTEHRRNPVADRLLQKIGLEAALHILSMPRITVQTDTVNSCVVVKQDDSAWKTIEIPEGRVGEDLARKLREGFATSEEVYEILLDPSLKSTVEARRVEFERISVRDLGFLRPAGYDEICACAYAQSLEPSSVEETVQLRLQFLDQNPAEKLIVALDCMVQRVYALTLSGSRGIYLYRVRDALFSPEHIFVFRRRS